MNEDDWHQRETYKSLMVYGTSAVRFVLLANGGAIIALLTFVGDFLKNNQANIDMTWAIGCYLAGIILGGIANVAAYRTQLTLYNEKIKNAPLGGHVRWLNLTIILIISGIILFSVGSILAVLDLRAL
ncbi:MAG: hypothetical protein ACR2PR_04005 [Pseudohongiellaceae bacterium]